MRKIKFRVLDNNDGKIKDVITLGKEYVEVPLNRFPFTEKIYDYVLMQYTGMNDINGVEIFEGDVFHQGDENIKYKVIFRDGCFIGNQLVNKSLSGLAYFIKSIEVIGNVYQMDVEKVL